MSIKLELEKCREIRAMLGDADQELIHDTLEGQTDLFEIMDWILNKLADEAVMQDAIKARIESLQGRKKSSESRVVSLKSALEACMVVSGEKSIRRPDATVTLGSKKPSIQSIDEAVLPAKFFKMTREVSRPLINEAYAAGERPDGVVFSNGGQTLTVRF